MDRGCRSALRCPALVQMVGDLHTWGSPCCPPEGAPHSAQTDCCIPDMAPWDERPLQAALQPRESPAWRHISQGQGAVDR